MKLTAGPLTLTEIYEILRVLVIKGGQTAKDVVNHLGVPRLGEREVVVLAFVLNFTVASKIRRHANQQEFDFEFEFSTEKPKVLYQYMAHMATALALALGLEREVDFDDGTSKTTEEAIGLAKRLHDLASGHLPE